MLLTSSLARHPGVTRPRIDPHVPKGRKVDHHAFVAGRLAGQTVSAALDGEEQSSVVARKIDRRPDVGRASHLRDDCGVFVERGIPDAACDCTHRRCCLRTLAKAQKCRRRCQPIDAWDWTRIASPRDERAAFMRTRKKLRYVISRSSLRPIA